VSNRAGDILYCTDILLPYVLIIISCASGQEKVSASQKTARQ